MNVREVPRFPQRLEGGVTEVAPALQHVLVDKVRDVVPRRGEGISLLIRRRFIVMLPCSVTLLLRHMRAAAARHLRRGRRLASLQ